MYLLDTNVLSELRKLRSLKADPRVAGWAASVDAADLFLSVVTIEEIEIGMLHLERRDPVQGAHLRAWMTESVLPTFRGRILSIDTATAFRSATLHVPDARPVRDMLIAATAIERGMTLVTRNIADMNFTAAKLLNPWEWQADRA